MILKNFGEYPLINNFDKYQSDILGMNGITNDNISYLLPDLDQNYNIEDYLLLMERIDKGKDFVDFIKANKNHKFCVVGDYDCDGIMATSIMTYGLQLYGCDMTFTIPDRFEDGYGMHKRQIDIAKANGADIIITVDNGITANEAIDYAHSKGMKVIVTDHHTPQGHCNGDLVFDPLYNNDNFKTISGATVAMKLIYELYLDQHPDGILDDFMRSFVCMAFFTVYSDVMPIIGENRYISLACMSYLNKYVNKSGTFINRLAKLVDYYVPGMTSDPYLNLSNSFRGFNKDNIDFYFVPIINACNRVLGDVTDLVFDIMCLFVEEYNGVPHLYSGINKKRKYMKSELIHKHKQNNNVHAVVEAVTPDMWDDNYSGIVGLVASDVVDKENKPALIGIDVRNDDDIVHFSGRSVSGFNLYQALSEIKTEHPELTLNFGGHAEALGASCKKKDIPYLQQYLSDKFINTAIQNGGEIEKIKYLVDKNDLQELRKAYNRLAPFGNKFEFPKFYIEDYILYLEKETRSFSLASLGKENMIHFFDKATGQKIENFAFKERNKIMHCEISFMEDDSNNLVLKLDHLE